MGYSPERKAAVLKRMLPPNNLPVRRLSQEEGISGLGSQLLPHPARAGAAAAPWPGKARRPAQTADQLVLCFSQASM